MQFKITAVGLHMCFAPETLTHMRGARSACKILFATPQEKK